MATFVRSDRTTARAAGAGWSRHRLSRWGWRIARYTVLITALVIFLMPLVWIWSSALKSSLEIDMNPFGLPGELHWDNLVQAWTVGGFGRYIGNSVLPSRWTTWP